MGAGLGLIAVVSVIWFTALLPAMAVVYARRDCRNRKPSTGLVVALAMLGGFYASPVLIWKVSTAAGWEPSFLTTLQASVDAEKYGHEVEHKAEVVVVGVVLLSTLTASGAGAIAAAARQRLTASRMARNSV